MRATAPPGPACCTRRTGRSRRRPSSRWRPRGRCAGSTRARSPSSATSWCWATPSTCSSRRGRSGSPTPAGCTGSWAGSGRSSPTPAASRSSRWPTAASPTRSRAAGGQGGDHGSVVSIGEEGVRFRSYLDGSELFISPEVSMEVQAALGSDIALVFDECTPFHADRDYTARSTERTHRWLDRCLAWHERERAGAPGGLRDRPGRRPRGPAPRVGRVRLGGRRRRDRDRRHPRPRQGGDARGAGA